MAHRSCWLFIQHTEEDLSKPIFHWFESWKGLPYQFVVDLLHPNHFARHIWWCRCCSVSLNLSNTCDYKIIKMVAYIFMKVPIKKYSVSNMRNTNGQHRGFRSRTDSSGRKILTQVSFIVCMREYLGNWNIWICMKTYIFLFSDFFFVLHRWLWITNLQLLLNSKRICFYLDKTVEAHRKRENRKLFFHFPRMKDIAMRHQSKEPCIPYCVQNKNFPNESHTQHIQKEKKRIRAQLESIFPQGSTVHSFIYDVYTSRIHLT